MRGSKRERRPGVWELRVDTGTNVVTGKRRQVSRMFQGTRRDADQALARLLVEVGDGRHHSSPGTLGQLLDAWLDLIADQRSPTTMKEYRRLVRSRIKPALGDRPLRKITAAELDRYYTALGREAKLSSASIRQIHAVIRRACSQAVRWGWLTRNPAVDATPPSPRKTDLHPPSPVDVAKILKVADERDPALGVILRLAAATGARRGELCALRVADLDLEHRKVTIARSIAEGDGGLWEKDTKTHAVRRVSIDADTARLLAAHVKGLDGTQFVFSGRLDHTRPLAPSTLSKGFRSLCDAAGVPRARLHDLRHFNATRLLDAGVPVRTVSGRLGHSKASTTHDIYSHWIDARDEEAADVMGRLLE